MAGFITRRGILLTGAVAGVVYGTRRFATTVFAPKLEFTEMSAPSGFRKYSAGAVSSAYDPFVGLGAEPGPEMRQVVDQVTADPCTALFGPERTPHGIVPVASFSDYNCPYCRVLTQYLAAREEAGIIRMSWHELPLLGDTSVQAARAALAAKQQDAYALFHKRLMRAAFQTTPEYVGILAESLALDPVQMAEDMNGPQISAELINSAALARLFGIIGTPALVVGSTFVQGEISEARLDDLIALEAERPGHCAERA